MSPPKLNWTIVNIDGACSSCSSTGNKQARHEHPHQLPGKLGTAPIPSLPSNKYICVIYELYKLLQDVLNTARCLLSRYKPDRVPIAYLHGPRSGRYLHMVAVPPNEGCDLRAVWIC